MSKRGDQPDLDSVTKDPSSASHPTTTTSSGKPEVLLSPGSSKKRQAPGQTMSSPTMSGPSSSAAPRTAPEEGVDLASSPMGPPPAKKSRTNTPWTPAEEQRLKTMRDAGSSWAEIAKVRSFQRVFKEEVGVTQRNRKLTLRTTDISSTNRREC
jgi:hypothetical protein